MSWQADLTGLSDPAPGLGGRLQLRAPYLKALLSCEAVMEELPLVVDDSRRPSRAMAEHLRSCLSCQAELVGYRRLLRALRSLRDQPVGLSAPALGEEVQRALAGYLEARSKRLGRWRLAGAGALALAALAVAALGGGAALARVSRQSRLLPGGAGAV